MTRTRTGSIPKVFRALSLGALVLSMSTAGHAAPLRSGKITVSAPLSAACFNSPTCQGFTRSGCNTTFQASPQLEANIVDVSNLANGTTIRTFKTALGAPAGSPLPLSGVNLTFWTASCTAKTLATPIPFVINVPETVSFKIPSGTKWMIVSGGYAVNVDWTLA